MPSRKQSKPTLAAAAGNLAEALHNIGGAVNHKVDALAETASAGLKKARTDMTKRRASARHSVDATVEKIRLRLKKAVAKATKSVERAVAKAEKKIEAATGRLERASKGLKPHTAAGTATRRAPTKTAATGKAPVKAVTAKKAPAKKAPVKKATAKRAR